MWNWLVRLWRSLTGSKDSRDVSPPSYRPSKSTRPPPLIGMPHQQRASFFSTGMAANVCGVRGATVEMKIPIGRDRDSSIDVGYLRPQRSCVQIGDFHACTPNLEY